MDIEHLTRKQIVLLTLLIAFVSSIVTSIATVSLMEQAPPSITQTINRVVERTVERVVPTNDPTKVETVREVTIVSEQNVIADAVEKNNRHLVRLYEKATTTESIRGFGVVIAPAGLIMTGETVVTGVGEVYAIGFDGIEYNVSPYYGIATSSVPSGVAFLRLTIAGAPASIAPQIIGAEKPRLGSQVFSMSGKSNVVVEIGSVREVVEEGGVSRLIKTTINTENILFGSPLYSSTGELVGIHTTDAYRKDRGGYTSTNRENLRVLFAEE